MMLAGLTVFAEMALRTNPSDGDLSTWLRASAQAFDMTMPVLCFGVGTALVSRSRAILAVLFYLVGLWLGLAFTARIFAAIAVVPKAAAHQFLIGPLSLGIAGVTLILPDRVRSAAIPASGLLLGTAVALSIRLTDPSLHDPMIVSTGGVAAMWLVLSVGLTVRSFRREWFAIAGRILGSWMLTAGLLYGGVSLALPGTSSMTRPPAQAGSGAAYPGFDTLLPDNGAGYGSDTGRSRPTAPGGSG